MSRAMEKMESSSIQQSQSSEQPSKTEELLQVLITTLTSQSERIKKIEDAQVSLMLVLTSKTSTSEDSQLDSLVNDSNAIKTTLNEHSTLLSALSETVSDKRVVTLSDGSKVKASDLDAYNLMKKVSSSQETTTTALGKLAKEVHAKSTVTLDTEAVVQELAKDVNEHFDDAVQKPVDSLRSDLEGFRDQMATLGAERLSEVRRDVVTLMSEFNDARRQIKAIERRADFVGISRLALALLPLCTALILVGGLVWGFTSMVGIGPLFGWIWTSFTAASVWWHKLLIALGGIGAAALFVWIVLRVSQWVYENLR